MNSLDQRKFGFVAIALVVIGVGIYFYQQSSDQKEQEAKTALYQIQKTSEEETNALPAKDREAGVALDVDTKFPKTVAALQKMISDKSVSARVLFEAGLKLGNLYLAHQQPAKAIAPLKTANQNAKTSFQKASSFYLVGVASERAQQWKDAIDAYQKGAAENIEGLKGECFIGLIRANMKAGDQAQAKLFAEKVNKDLAGTKYVETANQLVKGGK